MMLRAFFMTVVCAGSLYACSRSDAVDDGPTMILTRVSLADSTPADVRPVKLDLDASKGALYAALERAGYVQGAESSNVWRATVEGQMIYGFTVGEGLEAQVREGADAQAVVSLELKLKAPNEPEAIYLFVQGSSREECEDCASKAPAERLENELNRALQKIEASLKARRQVLGRDAAGLAQALSDPTMEIRLAAAERLGMMRASEAVPALMARLTLESERDVLLRLIGALAEIGDDRATPALIALADPSDFEMLRPILDALSSLGGERVSDFFDILEAHDSAAVRDMLVEPRARLERSQSDAGLN